MRSFGLFRGFLLLFTLLLAACGTPVAESETSMSSALATATTATTLASATPAEVPTEGVTDASAGSTATTAAFPLRFTDALGRSVELAAEPQRIVSLAPSNTEILFAIGAGEQVVGVTKYCNFPQEATTRDQIGGFSAKTINVEAIVALKPDLVVAGDESQQPVIDALEQVNVPVMAIKARTFDDVYTTITQLGQVTAHVAEAERVVVEMRGRVDAVTAKTARITDEQRLTVFYEVFDEPLMTAGPDTFIGQLIELTGAKNVFGDVQEEYPQISVEEVVRRNPQVIVGPTSHAEKLTADQIAARPGWQNIDAIRNRRVIVLDGDIVSRAGPRLADALETLARDVYPDVFK